jgi:transketolase
VYDSNQGTGQSPKHFLMLQKQGILLRVIDLYGIKPLDETTLRKAATATKFIFTVEDHYPEGGIGEAVRSALAGVSVPVHSLAV